MSLGRSDISTCCQLRLTFSHSYVHLRQSLAITNFLLFLIFFTRSVRDLATSQSWLVSIWNPLDMNGRVTTFAYFVFFCFWEFLPTVLLLCLITTKAGGVGGTCACDWTFVARS